MSGMRRIPVSAALLARLLRGEVRPAASTCPPDVKVVGARMDLDTATVDLYCVSAVWPPEQEGARPSVFVPEFSEEMR
jgi:hypothetical protein